MSPNIAPVILRTKASYDILLYDVRKPEKIVIAVDLDLDVKMYISYIIGLVRQIV